jgi:hypothetical protein
MDTHNKNVIEIFNNSLLIIDKELNNYFNNLSYSEATDFLKWLELDLLNKWKRNQIINTQPTNIRQNGFLKSMQVNFNQKIEYLENWLKEKKTLQQPEAIETANTETGTLKENKALNRNDWSEKTFNLFNYLIENYETKGKVKYANIFKFLNNIDKTNYAFNFTEKKYKAYILDKYGVKITTFTTANFKYPDIEQPILNQFEQEFRKQNTK